MTSRPQRIDPLFCGLLLAVWSRCAAPDGSVHVPADRCQLRVWFSPDRALAREDIHLTPAQVHTATVVGSWNGFLRPGVPLRDRRTTARGQAWYTLALPLPAGRYQYAVHVGDHLLLDDIAPQSTFLPDPRYSDSLPYEAEFTVAEVPDCAQPWLQLDDVQTAPSQPSPQPPQGQLALDATLWLPEGSPARTSSDFAVRMYAFDTATTPTAPHLTVEPLDQDAHSQRLHVAASGLSTGKVHVELALREQPAVTLSIAAFVLPSPAPTSNLAPPPQQEDAIIYHVLVDRFAGTSAPLQPPKTPGHRAHGTLAGITRFIEAGYFARLGVTTLWLSPLAENPAGLFTGRDGQRYEAYHGYWPSQPRTVEPALGGDTALGDLVRTAHRHGLRVLFDAVPNHVHAQHPYYAAHSRQHASVAQAESPRRASWFHDDVSACVCGTPGCDWSAHGEDCWFDRYLPDLNLRQPAALDQTVADLVFWLEQHDLDGMRLDAVPMMPRAAMRRMVAAARAQRQTRGLDRLILGETYTGPGEVGRRDIRPFLGVAQAGLDAAFDFPLMWALRTALAHDRMGLHELEAEIAASQALTQGSGSLFANLLDNHDTPRFLSEAVGNAGNSPWRDPPAQPDAAAPYRRHALAMAYLFTLPGIPVLYYGDEVAMAGANDPDSRRVLPDVLSPERLPMHQREMLGLVQRLGALRQCEPVIRRGKRSVLSTDKTLTIALHALPSPADRGPVLSVLSKASDDRREFLPAGTLPPGTYRDVLSGALLEVPHDHPGRIGLTVRAERAAIYVAETSACGRDR